MTVDLSATLARLEAWLAEHVPDIHAALRPGASEADLDDLETLIGLRLPESFRMLYRWHDGQNWEAGGVFGLEFLTLEGVRREWETWRQVEAMHPDMNEEMPSTSHPPGAGRETYTTPGWLGFLANGGGNSVGLDFDPGPEGTPGQVITFGRDEEHKYVLAESLDAFLGEYVSRLEAGRVTVTPEPLDDLEISEWPLLLHDADGDHQEGQIRTMADLYPGFGAAPARRSR